MALVQNRQNVFSSLQDALQNVENQYLQQLQEYEATIQRLQERIDQLEKYDQIEQILDEIEVDEKYDQPQSTQDNNQQEQEQEEEEEEDKEKTSQFWQTLENKFKVGDIEYIKELIRKNEIKMDDVNKEGRNLLMISTQYGSYELVSMCINLGANIDIEDNKKQTALKIATSNGFPGIYLYVKSTITCSYYLNSYKNIKIGF